MPLPKKTKSENLTIRLSAEDLADIDRAAEFHGLTRAGVLRMLARHEARRVGAPPAPTEAA